MYHSIHISLVKVTDDQMASVSTYLVCDYTTMRGSIALCCVHVNGEFSSHKKVNYEVPQLVKPKACLKDTRPEIPLIYYFVNLLISEKTGLDVLRPKTTWCLTRFLPWPPITL